MQILIQKVFGCFKSPETITSKSQILEKTDIQNKNNHAKNLFV